MAWVLPAAKSRSISFKMTRSSAPERNFLVKWDVCKKGLEVMKRYLWVLFVVCVLIPVPALAASPTILVLGDSLSAAYNIDHDAGWVSLLQQRLQQQGYAHRVVNASVSGDTTRGGLSRLPSLMQKHDPAVVIIELGGNDGLRGLPISEIRQNLQRMVRLARDHGARVLLARVRIPPNLGPVYREQFEAVFQTLAEREGIKMVPYILKGVAEDQALMQEDGLHPTPAAQPLILDNIWPNLKPLLTKQV